MLTPIVREVVRAGRTAHEAQTIAARQAAYAYVDAYRARCAEIRELDRRADAARATS